MGTAELIVLEGPDGVGKSTLAKALADERSSALLSFPGRDSGTLGGLVYQLHHEAQSVFNIPLIAETSLQLLHIAAHVDAIERDILPLIAKGTSVVLDRYWWSTLIYGRLRGVDESSLQSAIAIERNAWGDTVPSMIFLIDRAQPWRSDEGDDRFESLRTAYARLEEEEKLGGQPVVKVPNDSSVDEGVALMMKALAAEAENSDPQREAHQNGA